MAAERKAAGKQIQRSLNAWAAKGSEPGGGSAGGATVQRKTRVARDEDKAEPEAAAPDAAAAPEEEKADGGEAPAEAKSEDAGSGEDASSGEGPEAEGEEAPEAKPIAAKLKGIHRKIFRAEAPGLNDPHAPSAEETAAISDAKFKTNALRNNLPGMPWHAGSAGIVRFMDETLAKWAAWKDKPEIKDFEVAVRGAKELMIAECSGDLASAIGAVEGIDAKAENAAALLDAAKNDVKITRWKTHFVCGLNGNAKSDKFVAIDAAAKAKQEAIATEAAKKKTPPAPAQAQAPVVDPAAKAAEDAAKAKAREEIETKRKILTAMVTESMKKKEVIQKGIDLIAGVGVDLGIEGLVQGAAEPITLAICAAFPPAFLAYPVIKAVVGMVVEHIVKNATAGIAIDKINVGLDKVREKQMAIAGAAIESMPADEITAMYDKAVGLAVDFDATLALFVPDLTQFRGKAGQATEEIMTKIDGETVKKVGKERLKGVVTDAVGKGLGATFEALVENTIPFFKLGKKVIESGPEIGNKIREGVGAYKEMSAAKKEIEELQKKLGGAA